MQVYRVEHHRTVAQPEPDSFSWRDVQRLGARGGRPVDGPSVRHHAAGENQVEAPVDRPAVQAHAVMGGEVAAEHDLTAELRDLHPRTGRGTSGGADDCQAGTGLAFGHRHEREGPVAQVDGGLASGSVDGLPDAPVAAKEAASSLVRSAMGE
jgi:hypothetical protein